MKQLKDYYIASSHNTYLEGNQIFGKSNINCYKNFLIFFGGGCIEIDLIRIENNISEKDIVVGHYMTLTTELYLSDIFRVISEFLNDAKFKKTGPIIISFDNKYLKTDDDFKLFWNIFYKYLGDKLYLNFTDKKLFIKDIIGKILIQWEQYDENKSKYFLRRPYFFDEKIKYWTHLNSENTMSIESNSIFLKKYKKIKNIKFIRKYPSKWNINSGNFSFLTEIICGINMIALNFQKEDIHTLTMIDFFRTTSLIEKIKFDNIIFSNIYIKFDKQFTNIYVYKQNEIEKIKIHKNNCKMDIISNLDIIFIELEFNNKKYHGAITLSSNDNGLYEVNPIQQYNCYWYLELDKRKLKINIQKFDNKIYVHI